MNRFVEQRHVVQFRNWLQEAMPVADVVLTISKHSRNALIKLGQRRRMAAAARRSRGAGLGLEQPVAVGRPRRRSVFRSATCCSSPPSKSARTIGCWSGYGGGSLERHGADAVPTLIFAGQIGWLVDDLLADLSASDYLGGKIVLMPGLSDAELRQAYRSSLVHGLPEPVRGLGTADCGKLDARQVLRGVQPHVDPGSGRRPYRLFRSDERGRRAREDRAPVARSGLSGGAGGAAAGRIPAPDLGRLRSALVGKLEQAPSADSGAAAERILRDQDLRGARGVAP